MAPATVSDFSLDTYEVTVGRFRTFLGAYTQSIVSSGEGKNMNNPSDSGWTQSWNANLPADAAALANTLKCNPTWQTWTDVAGDNESRPVTCIDWYLAFAFCAWDGGRLPTLAEWTHAAAGGSEQRPYPWGPPSPLTGEPEPDQPLGCSYANYYDLNAGDAGGDYCVAPGVGSTSNVGTYSPMGNGKWGQADLAGNVWELVLDAFTAANAPTPCINCADFDYSGEEWEILGGAFDWSSSYLLSYAQPIALPEIPPPNPQWYQADIGVRCARNTP
jgi:formylglycine-generating enzyme required for sulfatase activity